jgi:hypothetical protein
MSGQLSSLPKHILRKLLGVVVCRGRLGDHRAGVFGIGLTYRIDDKLPVCMARCILLDILFQ